ncbi:MAG: hypothetical protein GY861_22685 [bacterium]|nr:hypothetical protein [bacterium]
MKVKTDRNEGITLDKNLQKERTLFERVIDGDLDDAVDMLKEAYGQQFKSNYTIKKKLRNEKAK